MRKMTINNLLVEIIDNYLKWYTELVVPFLFSSTYAPKISTVTPHGIDVTDCETFPTVLAVSTLRDPKVSPFSS